MYQLKRAHRKPILTASIGGTRRSLTGKDVSSTTAATKHLPSETFIIKALSQAEIGKLIADNHPLAKLFEKVESNSPIVVEQLAEVKGK